MSHSAPACQNTVAQIVVGIALLAHTPVARADYTTTIDPNTVLVDSFEGWGTSLCWWANVIGAYTNREACAVPEARPFRVNPCAFWLLSILHFLQDDQVWSHSLGFRNPSRRN